MNYQIFSILTRVIVHAKYTSNMAACYDIDVGDLTAPHE